MKKGQFKEIIKECIRELIDEGAFDIALEDVVTESMAANLDSKLRKQSNEIKELKQQVMQSSANRKTQMQQEQGKANPNFDLRQVLENAFLEETEDNAKINEHIKNLVETQAVMTSKGDKKKAGIMREIFADTAVSMVREKTGNVKQEEMDQLSSLASNGDPARWGKILNQSIKSKK